MNEDEELIKERIGAIIKANLAARKKKYYKKGWSAERAEKQRRTIYETRPWELATGAITPEGKAKVSRNATTHGLTTLVSKELKKIKTQIKRDLKKKAKKDEL